VVDFVVFAVQCTVERFVLGWGVLFWATCLMLILIVYLTEMKDKRIKTKDF